MSFLLGVEIDNSRVVWIYNSEQTSPQNIRLTTVSENQQKADIKFYIKKGEKKELLCSENLNGLPPMKAGEPSIDIKPRVSNKTFLYEIYLNDKLIRRSSHDLSKYLKSKKPLIISGIILCIFIIAALFFFLIPVEKSTEKPAAVETTVEKTIETEKPIVVEKPAQMPDILEQPESSTEELPIENPITETVFIESEITDRYMVYFQPESSELTSEGRAGLRTFINKLPGQGDFEEARFQLEIRGHCARYGTEEGRSELSKERAINVFNFLKSEWGIEADSIISGAGASEPVSLKRNEQHLNRRVDINIKGNIKKREQTN